MNEFVGYITFNGFVCRLIQERYKFGGTCISLVDTADGFPVGTATVWIQGYEPATPNHVLIKDYSENEGMLNALLEGGVIKRTGTYYNSGFVSIPEVEIIVNLQRDNNGQKIL